MPAQFLESALMPFALCLLHLSKPLLGYMYRLLRNLKCLTFYIFSKNRGFGGQSINLGEHSERKLSQMIIRPVYRDPYYIYIRSPIFTS